MRAASWVASSLVKSPVITHSPLVMACFTVGAESITSSIQMEMVSPTMAVVAWANFWAPSSLRVRATTYWYSPVVSSWVMRGSAVTTSEPSRMMFSAVVPEGVR